MNKVKKIKRNQKLTKTTNSGTTPRTPWQKSLFLKVI